MTPTLKLVRGDITKIECDAIVNAANSSLLGGGGVDGAIHRAGGPEILEACRAIRARQGSLETGGAVITTAGRLPAKFVIHTVGPVYRHGKPEREPKLAAKLADCYRNSLRLAVAHDCYAVAFPNISTGVYGYPKPAAASIAVATVKEELRSLSGIAEVVFVCFDEENFELYQGLL